MRSPAVFAFLLLLIFGGANPLLAQDFDRVDAVIQLYPKQAESAEALAAFINRDFSSDADKVRAIYGWLINNIAYDPAEYKALDYSFTTVTERNQKQEKFRFQLIDRVLQKGVAVCEGYAFVFERLCELTGVTSYLVRGDSKASLTDIGREYDINHMWNIALVDGEPFLFDATWGAGKYNGRFIKDPSYRYFQADPAAFIFTHYPQMQDDILLPEVLSKTTFESMPLIVDATLKDFDSLEPKDGILDSNIFEGYWQFVIPIAEEIDIKLSVDGRKAKAIKTEWLSELNAHSYDLDIPLGAQYLIFYFNDKPGLVYKVK